MDSGTASLIGVCVGAAITILAKLVEYRVTKASAASYLAARVVTTLDHFIAECVQVANDFGRLEPDGGLTPEAKLPTLELEKLDVDWKSIDSKVVYEVLQLPNSVQSAYRAIDDAYDSRTMPYHDYGERQLQFSRLGIEASRAITEHLLQIGDLPRTNHDRNRLIKRLTDVSQRIERQRKEHAETWRRHVSASAEGCSSSSSSTSSPIQTEKALPTNQNADR